MVIYLLILSILNRWKNYFSQLLNVHVSEVRQIEVYRAEPLVPVPSLEVEIELQSWESINRQAVMKVWQN
jgi:hypothetical protein